jgi:predicted Zn-dependent protease
MTVASSLPSSSTPASTLPPEVSPAGKELGLRPSDRANAEMDNIVRSIPQKPAAGEYFGAINKFPNGAVARWTTFPVLVHLPQGSPANWQHTLEDAVSSWGRYIPVRVAAPAESADIEIAWINHLPPKCLGQTNLEVFNGRMRVTVYLLRPSYYLANTSEKVLTKAAEHEVGHAIGLFGHSADPADLMFPMENASPKDSTKYGGISARDLNTLRKIYESPSLPSGFQSPHPMGWSFKDAGK